MESGNKGMEMEVEEKEGEVQIVKKRSDEEAGGEKLGGQR
jgi:hypothetical protein